MSPVTLYKKQKQILDYISQYIQINGHSPTLQEIAQAMGLSSLATVHEHIQSLEKKGILKRYDGAVRGLEIVDDSYNSGLNAISLPLVVVSLNTSSTPLHVMMSVDVLTSFPVCSSKDNICAG